MSSTIEVSLNVVLNATAEGYKASRPNRVSEFLKDLFLEILCNSKGDVVFSKKQSCLSTLTLPYEIEKCLNCKVSTNTVAFSGLIFSDCNSTETVESSIIRALKLFQNYKYASIEMIHISILNRDSQLVTVLDDFNKICEYPEDFGIEVN